MRFMRSLWMATKFSKSLVQEARFTVLRFKLLCCSRNALYRSRWMICPPTFFMRWFRGTLVYVSSTWSYWLARKLLVSTFWRYPPYWVAFRSSIIRNFAGALLFRERPNRFLRWYFAIMRVPCFDLTGDNFSLRCIFLDLRCRPLNVISSTINFVDSFIRSLTSRSWDWLIYSAFCRYKDLSLWRFLI